MSVHPKDMHGTLRQLTGRTWSLATQALAMRSRPRAPPPEAMPALEAWPYVIVPARIEPPSPSRIDLTLAPDSVAESPDEPMWSSHDWQTPGWRAAHAASHSPSLAACRPARVVAPSLPPDAPIDARGLCFVVRMERVQADGRRRAYVRTLHARDTLTRPEHVRVPHGVTLVHVRALCDAAAAAADMLRRARVMHAAGHMTRDSCPEEWVSGARGGEAGFPPNLPGSWTPAELAQVNARQCDALDAPAGSLVALLHACARDPPPSAWSSAAPLRLMATTRHYAQARYAVVETLAQAAWPGARASTHATARDAGAHAEARCWLQREAPSGTQALTVVVGARGRLDPRDIDASQAHEGVGALARLLCIGERTTLRALVVIAVDDACTAQHTHRDVSVHDLLAMLWHCAAMPPHAWADLTLVLHTRS